LRRLLDMAPTEAPPFNIVVVTSFSRFARDHFVLEFQVRRLRKHGVRLISITQDLVSGCCHANDSADPFDG
jgi:DNA invertase Pin-like site-specific DNA recombinase